MSYDHTMRAPGTTLSSLRSRPSMWSVSLTIMAARMSCVTRTMVLQLVEVGHLDDEAHHAVERLRIEPAERLVHQEEATRLHDLLGDGDPLPLPARELRGVEAPPIGEAEGVQKLARALVRLRVRHAPDATCQLEVAADRAVLEERVVLEDEAHRPRLELRSVLASHRPPVGLVQPRDEAEEPRLAHPRRTEQTHDLPRHRALTHAIDHLEAQVLEDDRLAELQANALHVEQHLVLAHRFTRRRATYGQKTLVSAPIP